jgi:glycosyltransferase involved in cell wall biosynthesis
MKLRLAVVVPRFGDVVGGAELHARWLAERLALEGHTVEVLTTCALDHYSWKNVLPPGVEHHGQLTVRGFLTNDRDFDLHQELERAIRARFPLTKAEELLWLRNGVSSSQMEDYLVSSGDSYDLIIGMPYLFGTTYFSMMARPERAVVIPCLHDEPYAHTRFLRELLGNVRGVMFNTTPEAEIGKRLAPKLAPWGIVGLGFDNGSHDDPDRFREKHKLTRPFLLYVGRREGGKNLPQLFDYFMRHKDRRKHDVVLAVAGSGEIPLPASDSVIGLKIDWTQERDSLYRAALAVCQPSINESLSIVLMQAWMAERPVIVHGQGEVTKFHCQQSNGGLWYSDYGEFEEVLDLMISDSDLRTTLGRNGRNYVEREYSWEAVLERFNSTASRLMESRAE